MGLAVDLVLGALALDPDAFRTLLASEAARHRFGLAVVVLAGLSLALGQSVALFAERVSPRRFAATLLVQALLFAASFLAWAASTWAVARLAFGAALPLRDVVAAVGLAHAPQLFGAFVLTPYLGTPLHTALSVWTLLAVLVATAVTFGVSLGQAVVAGAGGWLLTLLLQRTVGAPIVRWGRRLRTWVAGTRPGAPEPDGP